MKNDTLHVSSLKNEISIKVFFQKIAGHKWLLLGSIAGFVMLAVLYILLASPKYEVATSILIDPSGDSRTLGDNEYVPGGVSLIETEKNLYNEIGILKSYSLTEETIMDLGFNVSYHSGSWLNQKEHYGYYPFQVKLDSTHAQLFGVPFEISIVDDRQFQIEVEADHFTISNPSNGSVYEIDRSFEFSGTYAFGTPIKHDYFHFTLIKPDFDVHSEDFEDNSLHFIIHNPEEVTKAYLEKLEVNNIDLQASIFNISTVGTIIAKERDYLNKLTENYQQLKLDARNQIAATKQAFVRKQLEIIGDSLLNTELNLEAFKSNKRAVNLSATAMNALDRTQNLQVDRSKIQMEIDYYESLIDYIENNRDSDEFIIPASAGIQNPLMSESVRELQRLYALRAKKKFYLTPNNEEMRILNGQIDESLKILLSNLRNAIKTAELNLSGLQSEIASYNGLISTLPRQEKELLGLQRKSTLYESLFNYLSQELAKTEIAGAEMISDTRVLDKARMQGSGPVAPQKMLLITLAVILGILTTLIKMVWFPKPETINEIGQIIQLSDIPVIASIAKHEEGTEEKRISASLWKVKESFRDLYANLKLVVNGNKQCKVIGITSVMPNEGKTFCAINIGITLAEAGHKTLIIDMDLRSPSLISEIQEAKGKGLSDYLSGDLTSYKEMIRRHDEVENLSFIPTAVAKDSIPSLLNSPRMKSLLLHLKDQFEYVILDTPAVGIVSDYLLFMPAVDVNLFVVRRKHSQENYLSKIQGLIAQSNKTGNSYIIFNDAKGKGHKYGYGEKYGDNQERQLISQAFSLKS